MASPERLDLPKPPSTTRPGQLGAPVVPPPGQPSPRASNVGSITRPVPEAPLPGRVAPAGGYIGRVVPTPPSAPGSVIPKQPPTAPSQIQPPGVPPAGAQPTVRSIVSGPPQPGGTPPGQDARVAPPGPGALMKSSAGPGQPPAPQDLVQQPPMPKSPLGADSPLEKHLAESAANLPAGQNAHMRAIALGGTNAQLPAAQQKLVEHQTVEDFARYGHYSGADDPNSPPPPIRPGKSSFNPTTGQWILPKGQPDVLGRLMRGLPRGFRGGR